MRKYDNRRKKVLNKIKDGIYVMMNLIKGDLDNGKGVLCISIEFFYKKLRELIGKMIGKKGENLRCEGNNYYDIKRENVEWMAWR